MIISTFVLIIQLTGFISIQADSAFQCFVTRKAQKAILNGDPVRARASAYIDAATTFQRYRSKYSNPISKAIKDYSDGKFINRYMCQPSDGKLYMVIEFEFFNGSKAQQIFETCLHDVGFPHNTKILYYTEEEDRDLPPASPASFPKSEKDFKKWGKMRLKREAPPMPLLFARLVYLGGFLAFLFHPPILLYLGRRWKWKVPIPFICIISIFAGWFLIINYLICQDVYLESAIHNGATELSHYHNADGARNLAAAALGWMFSSILLLIWAPILLVGRFIYRRLKHKS